VLALQENEKNDRLRFFELQLQQLIAEQNCGMIDRTSNNDNRNLPNWAGSSTTNHIATFGEVT